MAVDRSFTDLLPGESFSGALLKRQSGFGSVKLIIRITIAATLAWLIATHLSQSTLGIFAPITTLAVVQASPWSTLGISLQRIAGTGLGVLAASVWVNLLGLSWWTFGIGLLISLLVARVLPFSIGGQIQIPIAVVFVLAIGPNSIEQDVWRVLDVVIGGAIGLIAVWIWPSRPPVDKLLAAMTAYRDEIVDVLKAIGSQSGHGAPGAPHEYVKQSRQLREGAALTRDALAAVAEGSHANIRAAQVRAQLPVYALSVRRLMSFAIQVRGLAGAADVLYDRRLPPALTPDQLRSLIDALIEGIHNAMGQAGSSITLAGQAGSMSMEELAQQIRVTAAGVVAEHGDVTPVLESVSVLGRCDYLRIQIQAYASGEHVFSEED
jgi:uncharacterized membrane protein YccC